MKQVLFIVYGLMNKKLLFSIWKLKSVLNITYQKVYIFKQSLVFNMINKKIFINTDGGSRGNPGRAAIGIVIFDENRSLLAEHKECIGEATNNIAEYKALIRGLEIASAHTRGEVHCFLDSEVVVRQVNGAYRLKAEHLRALYYVLKDREKAFSKVIYNFVQRENKYQLQADRLVNDALDNGQ